MFTVPPRTPEPIPQAARWLALIEEYDFHVIHKPAEEIGHVDALSCRPCRQCGCNENEPENETDHQSVETFVRRAGCSANPDYRPGSGNKLHMLLPSECEGRDNISGMYAPRLK